MKKDEKCKEAFAGVSEFRDNDLEYFETLTPSESQLIAAENHHDELFLIDFNSHSIIICNFWEKK